jgi:hypothetical protein
MAATSEMVIEKKNNPRTATTMMCPSGDVAPRAPNREQETREASFSSEINVNSQAHAQRADFEFTGADFAHEGMTSRDGGWMADTSGASISFRPWVPTGRRR